MILLDFSVFLAITSVCQAQKVKTAYFFAGSVGVILSGKSTVPIF